MRCALRIVFLATLFFVSQVTLLTASAETHVVSLYDFYYSPKDITITQGDTVRFVWAEAFHDAVAGNPPGMPATPFQEAFKTPIDDELPFSSEAVFTRDLLVNLPAPNNVYDYYCTPHFGQGMLGSITVLRTPTDFIAEATEWQVSPPTSSTASASCSGVLNGDETEFTITCTHDVLNVTAAHIHSGLLGESGSIVCSLGSMNSFTAKCSLSQTQANSLFNGAYYINIHSSEYPGGEIRGQIARSSSNRTISGQVRFASGQGVEGVVVSDGTHTATTDSDGKYTILGVDSGVYQLTATKEELTIIADTAVSPTMVNANNPTNRNFTVSLGDSCSSDSDGDGICDERELEDGSNPLDSGSYREHVESPVYLLWNGFIDILNIVAVTNNGDTSIPVHMKLYDIDGNIVFERDISVTPQGEVDVIVNDMPGFVRDSFGILTLEFPTEFNDIIDGQMFYYRRESVGDGYEFAFGVPFVPPTLGMSAVGFNTFQPSLNQLEAQHQVAQWLSIVNLHASEAKQFSVEKYDQLGTLLSTRDITIEPFGRVDVEGGHVDPGPSTVGLNIIRPLDNSSPYIAQLYRYGGKSPAGVSPASYSFAFPLLARAGSGEVQRVPISVGLGAENWLEVINVLNENVSVDVEYYNSSGLKVFAQSLDLAPHAQIHLNAGSHLLEGQFGSVKLTPSVPNSIVGQSMYYYRDSQTGSVASMYGTPIRETFGATIVSSYNLFLEMQNWLKITNTKNVSTTVTVNVFGQSGQLSADTFTLDAYASIELGLQESMYGTTPDTFGVVELKTASSGAVFAELVRIRHNDDTTLDFAAPIRVR